MSSKGRGAESVESDFYATPRWATIAILEHLRRAPSLGHAVRLTKERLARTTGDGLRILEPTAGKGAIVKVLREFWPKAEIDACELDRGRAGQLLDAGADRVFVGDFAEYQNGDGGKYDLVITNPPFTIATKIIELGAAWMCVGGLNVHLLRQAILASETRVPFWRKHGAQQNILPKRPQFARSLRCGVQPKAKRCSFALFQELEVPVPSACPGCGGKLQNTSSDSADYAWFVFGECVERTWNILEIAK